MEPIDLNRVGDDFRRMRDGILGGVVDASASQAAEGELRISHGFVPGALAGQAPGTTVSGLSASPAMAETSNGHHESSGDLFARLDHLTAENARLLRDKEAADRILVDMMSESHAYLKGVRDGLTQSLQMLSKVGEVGANLAEVMAATAKVSLDAEEPTLKVRDVDLSATVGSFALQINSRTVVLNEGDCVLISPQDGQKPKVTVRLRGQTSRLTGGLQRAGRA